MLFVFNLKKRPSKYLIHLIASCLFNFWILIKLHALCLRKIFDLGIYSIIAIYIERHSKNALPINTKSTSIIYVCKRGKSFMQNLQLVFLEYFIKHPIMNIIIIDIMSIDHRLYVTLGSLHSINSSMINWTKNLHKFWFSQGLSKYKCRWWGISRCEDTKRHWVQWLIY